MGYRERAGYHVFASLATHYGLQGEGRLSCVCLARYSLRAPWRGLAIMCLSRSLLTKGYMERAGYHVFASLATQYGLHGEGRLSCVCLARYSLRAPWKGPAIMCLPRSLLTEGYRGRAGYHVFASLATHYGLQGEGRLSCVCLARYSLRAPWRGLAIMCLSRSLLTKGYMERAGYHVFTSIATH
ncbi:hypothetical protein DPMN_083105 [Dreissena polymorpha]|uniref:Uncharacterized protein n=1 Tax=Dreissena polymorpha TaxID=45954 RepID=A0A9D4BHX9_DREPO|nr:hypothetical protein DPMN_083105 [Dreissena polymorpha]